MNWLNNLFTSADGVTPWWGLALAIVILAAIGTGVAISIIAITRALQRSNDRNWRWITPKFIFSAAYLAAVLAFTFILLFSTSALTLPWAIANTPFSLALIGIAIAILGTAVLFSIAAIIVQSFKKRAGVKLANAGWATRELVFGALCIAVAFALSYLKFFQMPNGGTITPASMLPIMMFAYIYGTPKGLIVGLAYGLLQMLQGLYVVHWAQFIMDYMLAFMAISLTGLFRKNILPGILVGGLGRLFLAFLSGMIFFGEYAPAGQNVAVYSLVYNITYLGPEIAICFLVALIPGIRKAIDSFKTESDARKKKAQAA